jgi:hypothetical protein
LLSGVLEDLRCSCLVALSSVTVVAVVARAPPIEAMKDKQASEGPPYWKGQPKCASVWRKRAEHPEDDLRNGGAAVEVHYSIAQCFPEDVQLIVSHPVVGGNWSVFVVT